MTTKVKIERDGKVFYTIRSRFVFNMIMRDEGVCLEFLKLVFPELNIRSIGTNTEQTMENRLGQRGICLDVYIEEKDGPRVIDMEMQVADDSSELPKRSRYYSSTIDGWLLKKNEDYEKLCDTIVLFICPFDPFDRGQKVYTFEHVCREDPSLTLPDGQQIKFLNTVGVKGSVSKELQAVFDYITSDDGEAEDSFAKKLKDMVSKINADAERIGVVMTYEEDLQHRLWHRDREWQDKLDEKDALLEQRALQISDQAQRIEKQDAIIEDLRKQIEVLKTNAPA